MNKTVDWGGQGSKSVFSFPGNFQIFGHLFLIGCTVGAASQWWSNEIMMVKCSKTMVKCLSMMVKWVYDLTLISPSLTSISPSLTSILLSLAWSKFLSFEVSLRTIIKKCNVSTHHRDIIDTDVTHFNDIVQVGIPKDTDLDSGCFLTTDDLFSCMVMRPQRRIHMR